MQVDFMRTVDYWIGVPICALFTGVRKVVSEFQSMLGIKTASPVLSSSVVEKNLLFVELSEMGSAILVDPALRKAKNAGFNLHFVIFDKNKASLFLLNTIPKENIFGIRSESFSLLVWDTLRFLIWCRQRKIQAVVDLELFSRFTSLITFLSGAKQRIGYTNQTGEGLYRGNLFTDYVSYNPHIHITKNFIALIEPLFAPVEQNFVRKTVRDQDVQLAKAIIEPEVRRQVAEKVARQVTGQVAEKVDGLVAEKMSMTLGLPNAIAEQKVFGEKKILLINPNAGDMIPQRRWPMEHFRKLSELLLEKNEAHWILVTGSPQEREHVQKLVDLVNHPRIKNFAGEVKFTELPALYSLSDILVTNDSGPGHFSSVTDIKTYVLFGPETPDLYAPIGNTESISLRLACSPCVSAYNHRDTRCQNNICMKEMQPEYVASIIFKYLDAKS